MKSGNSQLPTRIHSNEYSFNSKMNILLLLPQSDWHTVHSLVCIMTAYLTQLVHGCHRSANDPEKILKRLRNSRKFIWREEKFKIWRKVLECLNYSIMMLPFPVKVDLGHFYSWFGKNKLIQKKWLLQEPEGCFLRTVSNILHNLVCTTFFWSRNLLKEVTNFSLWQLHSIWPEDFK